LYARAAELGQTELLAMVGQMYDRGEGIAADPAAAFTLYQKAAAEGDSNGLAKLAFIYYEGKLVKRDLPRAYKLLLMARARGQKQVEEPIAELEGILSPPETAAMKRQAEAELSAFPKKPKWECRTN
jgi:TPR repeat protein